jgi:hypothetical protein
MQRIRAGIQHSSSLDRILETERLADREGDERMLGIVRDQYTGRGIVLNGVVWCRFMMLGYLRSDSFVWSGFVTP